MQTSYLSKLKNKSVTWRQIHIERNLMDRLNMLAKIVHSKCTQNMLSISIYNHIYSLKRHSWAARQGWMAICHSLVTERLPALITVAMLCPDSQVYFSSIFLKCIYGCTQLPALITVAMLCPDSQVYFSSVFL